MYYKNDFLQKLQKKFGKFAINNLMMYIVAGMAILFVADLFFGGVLSMFAFSTALISEGEFWRVITFILIPPSDSVIFIIFALYFYWLIGSSLEGQWGAFRFNMFYLVGILGTIAAGLLTGFATNFYLNMSLFLAFALLFPNFQVRLFFVIPVKMKWLAILNLVFFAFEFITGDWSVRVALLVSLGNIVLFFGKDFILGLRNKQRQAQWKRDNRR
ncbi:MAG: hypothetical protein FWB98_05010 [Defluviitaleaceae bacterium]|nr:hypothetical protein [Defluviitaleaceae bacterium]